MSANQTDRKNAYDDYDGISPLTPVIAALVMFGVLLVGAVGFAASEWEGFERPVHRLQDAPDVDPAWQWKPQAHNFDHMYRRTR